MMIRVKNVRSSKILKPLELPDDAELEAVVPSALDDGRVTHFYCGRICTTQVLLLLDGLLHRLRQLTVAHFLLNEGNTSHLTYIDILGQKKIKKK